MAMVQVVERGMVKGMEGKWSREWVKGEGRH